eukprot:2426694-Rhodomonas_salina.2
MQGRLKWRWPQHQYVNKQPSALSRLVISERITPYNTLVLHELAALPHASGPWPLFKTSGSECTRLSASEADSICCLKTKAYDGREGMSFQCGSSLGVLSCPRTLVSA